MKNVLIDVDDTLTNFLKQRNNLIKKYIKKKKLNYKIVDINATKSAKVADWPLEECINFWHEIGAKKQLQCKSQKYCAKVVKRLKDNGYKIIIVTARPDSYFEAYKYTKEWLDKNSIHYDVLVTGQQNKKEAMLKNKIDIVIDDSVSTIENAQELYLKSILFTTNENKNYNLPKNCTRVKNWKQIEKLLINNNYI